MCSSFLGPSSVCIQIPAPCLPIFSELPTQTVQHLITGSSVPAQNQAAVASSDPVNTPGSAGVTASLSFQLDCKVH